MKRPLFVVLVALGLYMPGTAHLFVAAEGAPEAALPGSVTLGILEAKIKEVESNTDLSDEAKGNLIEFYRKASSNLQAVEADRARAAAFEEAVRSAPAQARLVRQEIEAAQRRDPLASLDADFTSTIEDIVQLLQKEQADLAAMDARRADFERRLVNERNRPAVIRERLTEATRKQQEAAALLQSPPEGTVGPAMGQAGRWELETRNAALSAEIKMLDQELLSQPARVDLLEAERDKAAGSVEWIGVRVEKLNELVNRARELEAKRAKVEVEETRREIEGQDPVLVRIAERNAELTEDLRLIASGLNALDEEQARAAGLVQRIEADLNDARATLESVGRTEVLGPLLLEQRESLPDPQVYAGRARARAERIAQAGSRRLIRREEARRIANVDQTIAEIEARITTVATPQLRDTLRGLVEQRQALLQKALEADDFYLRRLRELEATERKLVDTVRDYDDFLNEHLWWLRVAEPTGFDDLAELGGEARQLLAPVTWSAFVIVFYAEVLGSPVFWLALIVAAVLLWKRRVLIAAIEDTASKLGKVRTDSFVLTSRVLLLTLLVPAPLSLVLAAAAWQIHAAPEAPEMIQNLGHSLALSALLLYILRALRVACLPQGLTAAHFRWPGAAVDRLRTMIGRLTWTLVPTVLIAQIALDLNPSAAGGMIARLSFLVFHAALALAFYRTLHPRRGVLVQWLRTHEKSLYSRLYPVGFWLLVVLPLEMVVEMFTGYIYSATNASILFLRSLWLLVVLILLYSLALRWLRVANRRLAYAAALERRRAALAARQAEQSGSSGEVGIASELEEPDMDLAELSDETRELVTIAAVFTGLLGLALIWSPLFPALRVFDEVVLWYQTAAVDGEDRRLPITLADIGLALIYAIGTAVLVRRLPAMLGIILLQRSSLSEADRYTITTLTSYVIVAIGILLVLNTIGAQWSQLQWLVAALGVGIGFGLQEIVANFISGLIILFERPVRVGDVVTIGNTSGVVTKVRIRATTIRDWTRKELLVPNKDLITGQVLNWSLSDQVIRISVVVGVAYGSDVDKALALMREAAEEHPQVLADPPPLLSFDNFGDNALTLTLRAYLTHIDYFIDASTDLHSAINRKFQQAGISIAFPQRDLHVYAHEPFRVNIESPRQQQPEPGNAG